MVHRMAKQSERKIDANQKKCFWRVWTRVHVFFCGGHSYCGHIGVESRRLDAHAVKYEYIIASGETCEDERDRIVGRLQLWTPAVSLDLFSWL